MALTKEQQAIEDAYQRAKQRADAQKAIQLQQASENLAMQTRQNTLSREQAQASATQQGQQAYIAGQQAQRVLPSQLAQGGLSQSGYRSLAQQKMAQETTKTGQGVASALAETNRGLGLNLETQQQNYGQNVQSLQNEYNQDIADLRLNRQQRLANLEADTNPTAIVNAPTYIGAPKVVEKAMTYNEVVATGNSGRYTYDQYKQALTKLGVDTTTRTALLQNYLRNQASRNVGNISRPDQITPGRGEQVL